MRALENKKMVWSKCLSVLRLPESLPCHAGFGKSEDP